MRVAGVASRRGVGKEVRVGRVRRPTGQGVVGVGTVVSGELVSDSADPGTVVSGP